MKINEEQLEAELQTGLPLRILLTPSQAVLLAFILRGTLRHFDMLDGSRRFVSALADGIENHFPKEATNIHRVIEKGGHDSPS